MPRFIFNKLVRDKIPAQLEAKGLTLHMRKLTGADRLLALQQKLVEEQAEYAAATTAQARIEELADIAEVLIALGTPGGAGSKTVEAARMAKRAVRGGFDQGYFIDSVDVPDGHPEAAYFRARPQDFPQAK